MIGYKGIVVMFLKFLNFGLRFVHDLHRWAGNLPFASGQVQTKGRTLHSKDCPVNCYLLDFVHARDAPGFFCLCSFPQVRGCPICF